MKKIPIWKRQPHEMTKKQQIESLVELFQDKIGGTKKEIRKAILADFKKGKLY
jgi:hypothetical protein